MSALRQVVEDDSAEHQIRLIFVGHSIAVTCTCIQRAKGAALEMRTKWTRPEVIEVYEQHLGAAQAREGIAPPQR